MPLFSPSWTLLLVAAVVLVVLVRPKPKVKSAAGWHVTTVPADKQVKVNRFNTYDYEDHGSLQLSRSVLVRVERDKQSLTIAALDIGAEDFEEQISNAQAKAAEKAAALNAYVGSTA